MSASRDKLDRLGMGLVLTLALLTFASPLVKLHGPAGDLLNYDYQVASGVASGMAQLRSMLTTVSTAYQLSEHQVVADSSPFARKLWEIPFSVKVSWLAPWLIYLAFACACLALLDLVTFGRVVGKLSLAGGCFAVLAVVHLVWMGSDLQVWATHLLNSGLLDSGDILVRSMRLLVVNSYQIGPGLGLVGLAACLLLASFIWSTSAVSRLKSVVRREQRLAVRQPVRVRPLHPAYSVETCTSVDLSRSGLLLESASDHYYVGMEVYVTRDPRAGDDTGPEEHGSVVRVQSLEGGKCRFAISILSHPERDKVTGAAARQQHKARHPVEMGDNSL